MKIHHLNCGTFCPSCQRLLQGSGGWLQAAQMCCHCLVIETEDGLILVDTGLGVQDVQDWPDILQSVTADEVMAAAKSVLDRHHAVTGWLTTEEVPQ